MLGIDISSGTVERIDSNSHLNNSYNGSGERRQLEEVVLACKNPELGELVANHLAAGWRAIDAGNSAQALLAIHARDHIASCEFCKALAKSHIGSV